MKSEKSVDDYINNAQQWQAELDTLRKILNATKLEETIKWGAPCYTFEGRNVVGIAAFKSYVGLWFFQGALLSDPAKALINAQSGKTKAMRQWRFQSAKQIKVGLIKQYLNEATALAPSGREIKADRNKPIDIPDELAGALGKSKITAAAFNALSKSNRREYSEYIGGAKRAETRAKRLKKIIPMIRAGAGLNDKYRKA